MACSTARRTALALAALFALQLGAALASAAPCAVACCPGLAATGSTDTAPCRSLSPVSCCSESTAAPVPEASPPPVAAPAAHGGLLAPAVATVSGPARLVARVASTPGLRSVVLRL